MGESVRAATLRERSAANLANPANPDPAAGVDFGEQTWDEMMIGYFEYWGKEREGW